MSRTFGDGAAQLAGLTGRLLGWRPDEFWGATPAELAAILSPGLETAAPPTRSDLLRLMEADDDRFDRQPAD